MATSRRPAPWDPDAPAGAVARGREWQLQWIRATNCEPGARELEFFVFDTRSEWTVRLFSPDADSTSRPPRSAPVTVPPGGALAWVAEPRVPLVVPAGHALGVRWYDLEGNAGSTPCSWQYGAVVQPAGTAARAPRTGPAGTLLTAGAGGGPYRSFRGDVAGLRATWETVPSRRWWAVERAYLRNCERQSRAAEFVVLDPAGRVFASLPTGLPEGVAAGTVGAREWLTWDGAGRGERMLIPPGWSFGARFYAMAGDAPGSTCVAKADVLEAPVPLRDTRFDSTWRATPS